MTTASEEFSFPEAELRILAFWEREKIFERSLAETRDCPPYVFYDGPPFATGLPHHGHLVASTIKDIVPRYWTMKGRYVMRRFGWDCHGLPIEHEIDKQFGASVHDVVAQLGVKGYNDACRGIVQRYVGEWRKTITRLGRWVDFDDDYKTMDADYMESVWWVVSQLWEKGLIYRGHKVVPFSTALGTVLANFEATQNYQDVQDPAITVLFRLRESDGEVPVYLAAWTTTPWTLPSNLALCVGADIEYLRVRDADLGADVILAEARLAEYAKRHDLEIVSRLRGADLVGREYVPLFDYFADQRARGAFVVVADDYVTTESGTGIVHLAPAFGEDDFRVFREAGIEAFACPVDDAGRFTAEVSDFAGQYVKDADKAIIAALKAKGVLYLQDVIEHSYPFCYRSDTPLIYKAIPSWYVRVTAIRDALLRANEQIRWVPEHIKAGRFGKWLEGAIDWSISRNRVWGTPLPLWVNDETDEVVCIGSVDELERRTGVRVSDLHRENVDELTFTVAGQPGVYRRVPEVLDCWFESGSMPYAQLHYPFENQALFEAGFPAEFIAEGLDQTRGWFYTLVVLAAALYDKPAFRNVIVNGLVMAEDGKKMSKRLRNYTPPDELMASYGADALRLYLINSGVVRGEELRFTDDGVRDMVRRVLLPWKNAFNFLSTYARIDGWTTARLEFGDNVLDRWILSKLATLQRDVEREMDAYRLYAVVPRLFGFIEDLTNWYIRLNRARFWAEGMDADKVSAYSALFTTLDVLSRLMAPFAPFLAEWVYLELGAFVDPASRGERADSVHLNRWPSADPAALRPRLEQAVERMQRVILLGRQRREEQRINLRTPLRSITIVHRDPEVLDDLRQLEAYVARELNVKSVAYDSDESAYIRLYCKPNFPVLGRRLGKRMKAFQQTIAALDPDRIESLQATGSIEIDGERFDTGEIEVFREAQPGSNATSDRLISIALDTEVTPELEAEGWAREFVRHVQNERREQRLDVADRINCTFDGDADLVAAVDAHRDYVMRETLCLELRRGEPAGRTVTARIGGRELRFAVERQVPQTG